MEECVVQELVTAGGNGGGELDLPDEVWVMVFGLLAPVHTWAVTLTCRRWRAVFHSDPPLWRAFHDQLLGGPLVPAVLRAPSLPDYGECLLALPMSDLARRRAATSQYPTRLEKMHREAWFGEDEWRAALEWKVRRVRKWGVTPEGRLEWAARLGCPRLVVTLIHRHWRELSSVGRAQIAATYALRAAVCANDSEIFKMMLERGACATGVDADHWRREWRPLVGLPPALEAARWGNAEVMRLLIKHASREFHTFTEQETPMLVASSAGHTGVVEALLKEFGYPAVRDFDSEVPTADGECLSALCRACRGGHLDVVKLIVPDFLNARANWEGCNALWSATKEGRNEVINYLLDCDLEISSQMPIVAYASLPPGPAMQPATLIRLINSVLIANGREWTETTSMAWAVYTSPGLSSFDDRIAVYRVLESRGADINAISLVPGVGVTSPLRHAVEIGDPEMVAALLQCGADPRRLLGQEIGSADPVKAERIRELLRQHSGGVRRRGPNIKKRKRDAETDET